MEEETDVVPQTTTTAAPPSVTEEPNLLDISSGPAASLPEKSTEIESQATQDGAASLPKESTEIEAQATQDGAASLPKESTEIEAQATQDGAASLLDDHVVPTTEEATSANDNITPRSATQEPNLFDLASPLPEESVDSGDQATQVGGVSLLDDPVVPRPEEATSVNDDTPQDVTTSPSATEEPSLLDPPSPFPEASTDSGGAVKPVDDPVVPETEEVVSANDDSTSPETTTPPSSTEEPNLLDPASPFPEAFTGSSGAEMTQNSVVSLLDDPVNPETEEATSADGDGDTGISSPPSITENGNADDEGSLLDLAEPSPTATNTDSDPFIQESATPRGNESSQEPSQDVPVVTMTSATTTRPEDEATSPSDEHLSAENAVNPDARETPPSSPLVASSLSAMVDTKDEADVPPSSDNTSTSSSAENGNGNALSGATYETKVTSSLSALPAIETVEISPPTLSQPVTNDSSSAAASVPVLSSEDAKDTVASVSHDAQQLETETFPINDSSGASSAAVDVAAPVSASENTQNAVATVPQDAQQSEIETLQTELAQAQQLIESLIEEKEEQAEQEDKDKSSLLVELQSTLQEQMSLKAEAENKVRLVNDRVQRLETQNKELAIELAGFSDLELNLQQQMSAKAEAENQVRLVNDRVQRLETQNKELAITLAGFSDLELNLQQQMSSKAEAENKVRLTEQRVQELEDEAKEEVVAKEKLQRELVSMREERAAEEQEVEKIREQRADQERREIALTNRLNAAKKKEATKSNLAEQYEEDYKSLEQESEEIKRELLELKESKQKMEEELGQARKISQERFEEADRSLTEELRLNDERKRKMKAFVENKSEELREAKADNDALQTEATQTSRALMDLNTRYKQLHAQWVQSQTRNRELQRDLNRIKKDSDNLHKVGDTLEMKLSRSANETEEHKNKRLAAKHELMTVLRTLEVERDVSNKLRDSIKFTFTPKALSQQQLLKESLEEFEAQLLKLSQRLGKPLPPPANANGDASMNDLSDSAGGTDVDIVEVNGDGKRSEADMNRLIAKLEYETQHVSQCIMALTGGVERMNVLLDASGNRTCFTSLSEILTTGGAATAATHEETASMTGGRRLTSIHSSPRYGRVPGATPLR
jgi:hypothetical protein